MACTAIQSDTTTICTTGQHLILVSASIDLHVIANIDTICTMREGMFPGITRIHQGLLEIPRDY